MKLARVEHQGWAGVILALGQFFTHSLVWAARATRAWSDVRNGIEPGFSDIDLAVSMLFLAASLVVLYGLWRDRTWALFACLAWNALALPIYIDIALSTETAPEARRVLALRALGASVLVLVAGYSGIKRVVHARRLRQAAR